MRIAGEWVGDTWGRTGRLVGPRRNALGTQCLRAGLTFHPHADARIVEILRNTHPGFSDDVYFIVSQCFLYEEPRGRRLARFDLAGDDPRLDPLIVSLAYALSQAISAALADPPAHPSPPPTADLGSSLAIATYGRQHSDVALDAGCKSGMLHKILCALPKLTQQVE